jgi:tRNA pseudouridine13 synthase
MLTLSKTPGIGGVIKDTPEDFVVEEITKNGTVLELGKMYTGNDLGYPEAGPEAKFTVFVLQKKDWNTIQALKVVARKSRRGVKSVGFAGTKDRNSISTQLCSAFGIAAEQIANTKFKDIQINGAWTSDTEVKMGDLSGNRFTITIKNAKNFENIEEINKELGGVFPNYFGDQRFGFRNNNVQIGIDLMKGDFKGAAMKFLTDTNNENNEDAIAARKKLAEEQDFRKAIEYFPNYLKYERQVLEHLSMYPTDYAGAIRRLPRSLSLMFIHSVDSYIFNKEIEKKISTREVNPNEYGNMVGYDGETTEIEDEILKELDITKEHFKVKSMPELNAKGVKRLLFAPYNDLSFSKVDENSIIMKFSLQSGSYATVLMNEFMKN